MADLSERVEGPRGVILWERHSVACYCRHIASDNIEIRLMVDDVVVYRQAFASIDAASEFAITKMHAYNTPFY
jgi:hypothetical protein